MPRTSIGRAELETRPHILYRFYDRTGVLLYVGITVDFAERMKDHAKEKEWWADVDRSATKVEYYDTRTTARRAEAAAIRAEKPLENDQHNEWIEDDDEGDEAHRLALEILQEVDESDQVALLAQASADWDDEPVSDRDRDIEAARRATSRYWCRLYDIAKTVDEYLDLLPDGLGEYVREQAAEDPANERTSWRQPPVRDGLSALRALKTLLAIRAREVLDQLPLDEAREWVAATESLGVEELKEQVIFGARYANTFKLFGTRYGFLCHGPGKHGARCTKLSETTAVFEICEYCPPASACEGHRFWCAEHAEAVKHGDPFMLSCNPVASWPLKHIGPVVPGKELVPF